MQTNIVGFGQYLTSRLILYSS